MFAQAVKGQAAEGGAFAALPAWVSVGSCCDSHPKSAAKQGVHTEAVCVLPAFPWSPHSTQYSVTVT